MRTIRRADALATWQGANQIQDPFSLPTVFVRKSFCQHRNIVLNEAWIISLSSLTEFIQPQALTSFVRDRKLFMN